MEENFKKIGEKLWNSQKKISEWLKKSLRNFTLNFAISLEFSLNFPLIFAEAYSILKLENNSNFTKKLSNIFRTFLECSTNLNCIKILFRIHPCSTNLNFIKILFRIFQSKFSKNFNLWRKILGNLEKNYEIPKKKKKSAKG